MKKISGLLAVMVMVNGCSGVAALEEGSALERNVLGLASVAESVTGVVANRVEDAALVFTQIDAENQLIKYRFAGAERNLGLKHLVFASYKDDEYSQRMVEQGLAALNNGADPIWAQSVESFYPNVSSDYQWERRAVMSSDKTMKNAPGVLYYAALIQNRTDWSEHWVRGKLDYRECSYVSNREPHNVAVCSVSIDQEEQKYNLTRKDGTVENKYEKWSEELNDRLLGDLGDLEKRVKDWAGDAAAKEGLLAELEKVEMLAEDAEEKIEIRRRVTEYKGILAVAEKKIEIETLLGTIEQGTEDWMGDEEEKEDLSAKIALVEEKMAEIKEDDKGELPERLERCTEAFRVKVQKYEDEKKKDELGSGVGLGGSGGSGGDAPTGGNIGGGNPDGSGSLNTGAGDDSLGVDEGGSDANGSDKNGSDANLEESVGTGGGVGSSKSESVSGAASEVSKVDIVKNQVSDATKMPENRGKNEREEGQNGESGEKNDQRSVLEAEVPALNEGSFEQEGRKRMIWWSLGVILLGVGAGIWWVKRAFFSNKRLGKKAGQK